MSKKRVERVHRQYSSEHTLHKLLQKWKSKWKINGKSIIGSKQIWLFCLEYNLEVPQEVMKVFAASIQKQVDDHLEKHPRHKNNFEKEMMELELHICILEALEKYNRKRGWKTKAYKDFAKLMEEKTGEEWNQDRVKTIYARSINDLK